MPTSKKTVAKKTAAKKTAAKKTAAKKTAAKKRVTKKRAKPLTHTRAKRVAAEYDAQSDEIITPHNAWPWPPRPYQQVVIDKLASGIKRFGLFWHRRAGKDITALSLARQQALQRVGGYVHFMPKNVQARRALWTGVDPGLKRNFVDAAFGDYEVGRSNADMMLELHNGSVWQLMGSDNYDRYVGSNCVMAVFSEWALCDPRAWDFIRPILIENDGIAIFITTFRGRNHAWQMAVNLKDNPEWFIDVRGVNKTTDRDGRPIITPEQIQAERDSGMSEALIQQEYYCNPEATASGAIYGSLVEAMRRDSTRGLGHYQPGRPVVCAWNLDLPVFASWVIAQPGHDGERPVILEAGEEQFKTLDECLALVERRRYPIQFHLLPDRLADYVPGFHDLERRPEVVRMASDFRTDSATRTILETCRYDAEAAGTLLDSLGGYVRRQRFDSQTHDLAFGPDPVESWHWRQVAALETFAAWAYSRGEQWSGKPDYATQDRIHRVVSRSPGR